MKTLIKYLALIVLFFGSNLSAQNWPVILGDNYSSLSYGITEDYDNGILISAYILKNSTTTKQGLLMKTDINGNIIWEKRFGTGDYPFDLWKIVKTKDNGTILSGSTAEFDNGYYDPLFLKLNPCGEVEWCTVLRSELGSGNDYGRGIVELDDGSFIAMIKYYGHQIQTIRISLIKMDAYGYPLWIQHLAQQDSTVYNEEGYDLTLTSDSNYLVSGRRNGPKPYFIMCDTIGDEDWALTWNETDVAWGSVEETIEKDSGIFYASGGGKSVGFPTNPMLFKFDKEGNEIYHKLILGDTIRGGGAGPMEVLNDTTLVIGYNWGTDPNPNNGFSGVATTDTMGNIIERRLLVEQVMEPANIIKTFDAKIVVTGHYFLDGNWDVYLWKMNQYLEDDSIYTQPRVYDSLCPYTIVSDTIDLDCGLYVDIGEIPTREEFERPLKIFPNPANNIINITVNSGANRKLVVYDMSGKIAIEKQLSKETEIKFDISDWQSGLYLFCLFENYRIVQSEKVLVR